MGAHLVGNRTGALGSLARRTRQGAMTWLRPPNCLAMMVIEGDGLGDGSMTDRQLETQERSSFSTLKRKKKGRHHHPFLHLDDQVRSASKARAECGALAPRQAQNCDSPLRAPAPESPREAWGIDLSAGSTATASQNRRPALVDAPEHGEHGARAQCVGSWPL